jgi:acyl carrier protein
MEELLARVWQELLGVEQVGRHDHFFELGGHSLLAVRLLGLLQSNLNVKVELSTLFDQPSLADFAKKVLIASIMQEFDADELNDLILAEGK